MKIEVSPGEIQGLESIKIDPKQISDAITKAIIESQIGKQFVEIIHNKLGSEYNTTKIIEEVLEKEVYRIIQYLIRKEFEEELKTKIRECLSEELVSRFVGIVFDKFLEDHARKY